MQGRRYWRGDITLLSFVTAGTAGAAIAYELRVKSYEFEV